MRNCKLDDKNIDASLSRKEEIRKSKILNQIKMK